MLVSTRIESQMASVHDADERLSRPRRKSVAAGVEMNAQSSGAESFLINESEEMSTQKAVKGLKSFYFAEKKHIWSTVAVILAFVIGFIIFHRLYPRAPPPAVAELGPIPDECNTPDSKGCYDYAKCIAPGFDRLGLAKPDCVDEINPCGYECTCTVLSPKDLTDADFARSRFAFFNPKVTFVNAGLGGAFVISFFAALLLRKSHTTRDSGCDFAAFVAL